MCYVLDEGEVEGGNLTFGQLQEILGNDLSEIHMRLDELEVVNIIQQGGQQQ